MSLPENSLQRIVVSGCSAGGKTTLLNEMAARGYQVFPEAGRRAILEGYSFVAAPEAFLGRCGVLEANDYDAVVSGIALFDRSLLEVRVWYARNDRREPEQITQALATRRYCQSIFLTPPWPELFQQGNERAHDFQEALAEYDALCEHLPRYGYRLEDIPKVSVKERADWLEDRLIQLK